MRRAVVLGAAVERFRDRLARAGARLARIAQLEAVSPT
jgi:hypothetical protein